MKTIENIIPITIIVAFASALEVFANVPSRFFIGRLEVSESFFNSVPDSLREAKGIWISDSLVVESFELPITHKIDSVSATGKKLLVKRPDNEIMMIRQALGIAIQKSANDDFKVNEGERIMDSVTLEKLSDNKIIGCFIENGICYLLSFWATWCGNCLIELQEEYIPNPRHQRKGFGFKYEKVV